MSFSNTFSNLGFQPLSHVLTADDLTVRLDTKTVYRGDKFIQLGRTSFELLTYLLMNKNETVTREMILKNVWPSFFETETNLVDVHIKYLRDAVDRPFRKKLIKTVFKKGYTLEDSGL